VAANCIQLPWNTQTGYRETNSRGHNFATFIKEKHACRSLASSRMRIARIAPINQQYEEKPNDLSEADRQEHRYIPVSIYNVFRFLWSFSRHSATNRVEQTQTKYVNGHYYVQSRLDNTCLMLLRLLSLI
jgi:hypothetical protein